MEFPLAHIAVWDWPMRGRVARRRRRRQEREEGQEGLATILTAQSSEL